MEHQLLVAVFLGIFRNRFVHNLVVPVVNQQDYCLTESNYHYYCILVLIVHNLLHKHHCLLLVHLHHSNFHIDEVFVAVDVDNLDYAVVHELLCVQLEVVPSVQQQCVLEHEVVVLLVLQQFLLQLHLVDAECKRVR